MKWWKPVQHPDGMFVHPAYGARSDAPTSKPKAAPKGKRWTGGVGHWEVREWGVYAGSGRRRWTTWYVGEDGSARPEKLPCLVRPSFTAAEKALAAFAKRGGLVEVGR